MMICRSGEEHDHGCGVNGETQVDHIGRLSLHSTHRMESDVLVSIESDNGRTIGQTISNADGGGPYCRNVFHPSISLNDGEDSPRCHFHTCNSLNMP